VKIKQMKVKQMKNIIIMSAIILASSTSLAVASDYCDRLSTETGAFHIQ